jgi:hypothetical protein
MSERAKIEEKLRRKEAEIQSLEEKIKAGRIYVQALRDVLRVLADDESPQDGADAILRPGSAVAQARDAISAAGAPMHVDDLLVAMGKEPTREAKSSLIGSLSAYVRRGEIFTRPAPNTFGLTDLVSSSPEAKPAGPPSGFGRIDPSSSKDDNNPF